MITSIEIEKVSINIDNKIPNSISKEHMVAKESNLKQKKKNSRKARFFKLTLKVILFSPTLHQLWKKCKII